MKEAFLSIIVCWMLVSVAGSAKGASFQSPLSAQTGNISAWRTLKNRSGWSIKYPPSWSVWSCRNCSDVTDPDVYVSFAKPDAMDGMVMVEHLVDKPADQNVSQWFNLLKESANQIIRETTFSLNGLPAIKVEYKNTAADVEIEAIFVVSGSKTFTIRFHAERTGAKLHDVPNYAIYQQMLSTFEATP